MAYLDFSQPADIWPNPSKRATHLYMGREADRLNETKAGIGVDPESRKKGIGEDFIMLTVYWAFPDRDVAMAVEMLVHAYATVRYGRAIASDKIKSGRSEFFNCSEASMHSTIASAYKKAKALDYDAYAIGRYALEYVKKNGVAFPHDNKRNWGYIALKIVEREFDFDKGE